MRIERSEFELITYKLAEEIEDKHNMLRDIELEVFYEKRRKKQEALQKDCAHLQTFSYSWTDYHKGENWEETYCKQCGKLISRI